MAKPKTVPSETKKASKPASSERGGLVLGSVDATPLEFWIGVEEGRRVQLDDLVVVETVTADGQRIRFYGMVDVVRKRYEGTQFDSDVFRAAAGRYRWKFPMAHTCR